MTGKCLVHVLREQIEILGALEQTTHHAQPPVQRRLFRALQLGFQFRPGRRQFRLAFFGIPHTPAAVKPNHLHWQGHFSRDKRVGKISGLLRSGQKPGKQWVPVLDLVWVPFLPIEIKDPEGNDAPHPHHTIGITGTNQHGHRIRPPTVDAVLEKKPFARLSQSALPQECEATVQPLPRAGAHREG